jgi:isoquinoline 1-oxidoreductase subunit alpha
MKIQIDVNGATLEADVDPDAPLLWVLRDEFNLLGTKYGCGMGLCGACTVHVDGSPTRSCQLPIGTLQGSKVTTIEGLAADGRLSAVQQAWVDHDVAQCGYCQAGQIMTATALLIESPDPTDDEIDKAMSGNLCRCGTYTRIREAIRAAARSSASVR